MRLMIQVEGYPHFLVEIKAYSLDLSEKHLRQTLNYGANGGFEYALELTDLQPIKKSVELLQFIH